MSSPESALEAEKIAVLVPAAGEGHRLGGTRKQFRMLGGRLLLVQVLLLFEQHPSVGNLVVAVPEEYVQAVRDRLQAEGLSSLVAVVRGGEHRQASVRHALRAVPDSVKVVLVHDAARPFVSAAQVQSVVEATWTKGAASLAVPVADTLRHGDGETFGDTVPRGDLYRMQTPQGFRRSWLEEAHRAAAADDIVATDDVELVQRIGHAVHPVSGSRRNFKITAPEDWKMAQHLWESWVNDFERTNVTGLDSE